MKIYDLVKNILETVPEARSSDKKLIWAVWNELGLVKLDRSIFYAEYMNAPSTETIRRCRQKIQELNPELQASESVRRERRRISDQKGTHIYREPIQTKLV